MPHANPIKRLCWQLPLLQRKYRLDILHTQYILPIPSFSAGMVTIHDILFETHPQYFTSLFRFRSTILMRLSAWRASHVFTVSEFSRQEMLSRYRIAPEKISVIHNGVDKNRFYPGKSGQDIIERKGLSSKGYLLSVGRLEPRKNHVTLIRAYARLLNATLPLVIIGQMDFGFDEIFQVIQELKLGSQVIMLNDVEDDELPAFYRHAKLFAYPTWAEGFGMPPLEAMASGVPTISSDSTSIPEVTGNAAVLIEPSDINALANAIDHFLSDQEFYSDMQQRGFEQVRDFQWKSAAECVREVYLST
ncbi:glycosyltransferase family 4 protein, partial [Patescibacteria group bacterium]|nr:glycosyltransferase family 4 protein [Patescibacteria group bacterium]